MRHLDTRVPGSMTDALMCDTTLLIGAKSWLQLHILHFHEMYAAMQSCLEQPAMVHRHEPSSAFMRLLN